MSHVSIESTTIGVSNDSSLPNIRYNVVNNSCDLENENAGSIRVQFLSNKVLIATLKCSMSNSRVLLEVRVLSPYVLSMI